MVQGTTSDAGKNTRGLCRVLEPHRRNEAIAGDPRERAL